MLDMTGLCGGPEDNWYDIPDIIGDRSVFKAFKDFVHKELKPLLKKGGKDDFTRQELLEALADFHREGRIASKTVAKRIGQRLRKLGLLGFLLSFYFNLDDAAAMMAERGSACHNLLSHLSTAAKDGTPCNLSAIANWGEQCRDELVDKVAAAYGSEAATVAKKAIDDWLEGLKDACRDHDDKCNAAKTDQDQVVPCDKK
jgi:hypothetical protein